MSKKARVSIILLMIVLTPIVTSSIGGAQARAAGDVSGLIQGGSVILGVATVVIGLVVGVTVSFATRRYNNSYIWIAGYTLPSVATIIYLLFY